MKTQLSFLFFYYIFLGALFIFITPIEAQENFSDNDYYNAVYSSNVNHISIDSAIQFYRLKTNSFSIKNDTINIIYNLKILADAYNLKGELYNSELASMNSLNLIDNISTKDLSVDIQNYLIGIKQNTYHHLGILYKKINAYSGAIDYYSKALELTTNFNDSISLMNNIALIHKDEKNYAKADSILRLVYDKIAPLDNYPNKWKVLDNLGFVQSKRNISGAIEKMKIALKNNLTLNNSETIFSNYRHLAIYYLDRQHDSLATVYALKTQNIAKDLNSDFLKASLDLKMRLNSDPEVRLYQKLSDSLNRARTTNEYKYVTQKYNYEKAEKESIKIKSKADRDKQLYQFYIIVVLLIFIFSLLYYRQYSRRAKDRERHRTERALSKKVHDEVGNDLFYLMAQIQSSPHEFLEQNGLKLLDGLNEIYGKARDISKHYTAVHTGPNYNNELLSLLNSYGSDQIKIITNKIDPSFWETVEPHKKENLYRILQELLTNMKKHSNANFVAVTFTKDTENIHVKYVDNGCGVDLKTLTLKNGLDNVESRMVDLKGSITFESVPNKGFKAFIKLST